MGQFWRSKWDICQLHPFYWRNQAFIPSSSLVKKKIKNVRQRQGIPNAWSIRIVHLTEGSMRKPAGEQYEQLRGDCKKKYQIKRRKKSNPTSQNYKPRVQCVSSFINNSNNRLYARFHGRLSKTTSQCLIFSLQIGDVVVCLFQNHRLVYLQVHVHLLLVGKPRNNRL